jgi:hypothetical protein
VQKVSGKSTYKYKFKKSWSVFHQESNKIGFAFFRFSYDFLRNLQFSAKGQTLFKKPTFTEVLGTFQYIIDMPSVYTKLPRQKLDHTIGSSAMASGGPASPATSLAGKRMGKVRELT